MSVKNLRIVHISTVHIPFDTRIFHKECKTLVEAGFDVVLIATHGMAEVVEGIRIHPLRKPRSRWERIMKTSWKAFWAALQENAGIYHFHDSELIPVGILLKLLRKRVIYDVHEDLPRDILSKLWIPKRIKKIVALLAGFSEFIGTKLFDGVIAATPVIAARFPRSKTVIVQNFPRIITPPRLSSQSMDSGIAKVIYVGDITIVRGVREIVAAMDLVNPLLNVELVLVGRFSPPKLEATISQDKGWNRVRFVGWQSRYAVINLLSSSVAGLVTLHPEPNFLYSQPNKLYEYMSAGISVIASDFPRWREIIQSAGCGFLVNPLEPKQIADKIEWIIEHPVAAKKMGCAGKEAIHSRYNWSTESQTLLSIYNRLLVR